MSMIKNMKFSTKLLLLYLLIFSAINLVSLESMVKTISNHVYLSKTIYYFLNCFPAIILVVATLEIKKELISVQSWLSITICISFFIGLYFLHRPQKALQHFNIGHVEFTEESNNQNLTYSCDYNFDIQLTYDDDSPQFRIELQKNIQSIYNMLNNDSKNNCYRSDLEDYLNEKFLDSINKNLELGEIENIRLIHLSSKTSVNY